MPHFQVSLHGKNFWLEMDGKPARMGFYTKRFVVAESEADAEKKALQMLRKDPKLEGVLNDRLDPPMIYCEGIEPIEPFDPNDIVQHGYAFYPEATDS